MSKIPALPLRLCAVGAAAFLGLGPVGQAQAQTAPPAASAPAKPGATSQAEPDSGTMRRANPQMRVVLEKLEKLGAKPLGSQSVADTRRGPSPADAVKAVLVDQRKDPAAITAQMGVKVQEMTYPTGGGTQKLRVYTPGAAAQAALPVIVYYHGGGWVIADLDTYDGSARGLAQKSGAIVVSGFSLPNLLLAMLGTTVVPALALSRRRQRVRVKPAADPNA